MSSAAMPVPPPGYETVPQEEGEQTARDGENELPDDFKYSTSVAACAMSIRHAFIRKVYLILFVQLLVTFGLSVWFRTSEKIAVSIMSNLWTVYVAMGVSIIFLLLSLYKGRSYPYNLIFLSGFTLCEAYTLGACTLLFETAILTQAFLITLIVFVGISLFAVQSKYDFSGFAPYAMGILWTLIGVGIVMIFIPYSRTADLVYSSVGVLLFSFYTVFDTQSVMKRFHPEQEIEAALTLYLDFINMFLYILRILSASNNDN